MSGPVVFNLSGLFFKRAGVVFILLGRRRDSEPEEGIANHDDWTRQCSARGHFWGRESARPRENGKISTDDDDVVHVLRFYLWSGDEMLCDVELKMESRVYFGSFILLLLMMRGCDNGGGGRPGWIINSTDTRRVILLGPFQWERTNHGVRSGRWRNEKYLHFIWEKILWWHVPSFPSCLGSSSASASIRLITNFIYLSWYSINNH